MKLTPFAKPVRIRISCGGIEHYSLETLLKNYNIFDIEELLRNRSIFKWLEQIGELEISARLQSIVESNKVSEDSRFEIIESFYNEFTLTGTIINNISLVNFWYRNAFIDNIKVFLMALDLNKLQVMLDSVGTLEAVKTFIEVRKSELIVITKNNEKVVEPLIQIISPNTTSENLNPKFNNRNYSVRTTLDLISDFSNDSSIDSAKHAMLILAHKIVSVVENNPLSSDSTYIKLLFSEGIRLTIKPAKNCELIIYMLKVFLSINISANIRKLEDQIREDEIPKDIEYKIMAIESCRDRKYLVDCINAVCTYLLNKER